MIPWCEQSFGTPYLWSPEGTWRDGLLMDLIAREFDPA
jgi:hypothetical protein